MDHRSPSVTPAAKAVANSSPEQKAAAALEQKLGTAVFANGVTCTIEPPNETNPDYFALTTKGYFPAGLLAGLGFQKKGVLGKTKPIEFEQQVLSNQWTITADVMQWCFPASKEGNEAVLPVLRAFPGLENVTVESGTNGYTLKNLGQNADPATLFTGEFAPYVDSVTVTPYESVIFIPKADMMRVMGAATSPPR